MSAYQALGGVRHGAFPVGNSRKSSIGAQSEFCVRLRTFTRQSLGRIPGAVYNLLLIMTPAVASIGWPLTISRVAKYPSEQSLSLAARLGHASMDSSIERPSPSTSHLFQGTGSILSDHLRRRRSFFCASNRARIISVCCETTITWVNLTSETESSLFRSCSSPSCSHADLIVTTATGPSSQFRVREKLSDCAPPVGGLCFDAADSTTPSWKQRLLARILPSFTANA